jgi:outer membrane autotransporter protein
MLNQAGDLASGQGMIQAVSSASAAPGAIAGFSGFSYGSVRAKTGSHVDVDSFSFLTGLSRLTELAAGKLTLGAFFEAGNGDYDTFNDFTNAASVSGKGETKFLGGGFLGRLDFENLGPGSFYAELSGRIGQVETDFTARDLLGPGGQVTQYDFKSPYYGLHVGVGYIFPLTQAASLELYGKYLWNRQKGDKVTLSTGDEIDFKSVDSHRLRAGTRLTFELSERFTPYLGAAYEHEMDGKSQAIAYGRYLPEPRLKGGTGIGELGLNFKATEKFNVELGVKGYVGKREGVSGVLQINYKF